MSSPRSLNTPPPPSVPETRLTLPTPPSFSAHRARSHSISPPSPPRPLDEPAEHKTGRSVSFVETHIYSGDTRGMIYRIPQHRPVNVEGSALDSPLEGIMSPNKANQNQNHNHNQQRDYPDKDDNENEDEDENEVDFVRDKSRSPPVPLRLSGTSGARVPAGMRSAHAAFPTPSSALSSTSRFASTAAARGLSIAPALARGARHSTLGIPGAASIWSAGLPDGAGSGWISPGLASARSPGTAASRRGLTVAVIRDGRELIAESLPTPGIPGIAGVGHGAHGTQMQKSRSGSGSGSGNGSGSGGESGSGMGSGSGPGTAVSSVSGNSTSSSNNGSGHSSGGSSNSSGGNGNGSATPQSAPVIPRETKHKEIILCRYYHTPGLTCTSRPCRFVHNLDVLSATASASASASVDTSKISLKSPIPGVILDTDPTRGTFAEAQAQKTLSIKNLDGEIAPGETVRVEDDNGEPVVGTVFLMSGGGKGPAGKSRAKFKTVPCKDFADGNCPYGDYCSFIHEEQLSSPPPPSSAKPFTTTSKSQPDGDGDGEAGTGPDAASQTAPKPKRWSIDGSIRSFTNAWAKGAPKTIIVPTVKLDVEILDKNKGHLSPFAAPFLEKPVHVDGNGSLVSGGVEHAGLPHTPAPPPTTKTPVSAWSKGRPSPGAMRKVTIADDPKTPTSARHLGVPFSAMSLYTESDPATPWDPALLARKMAEAGETETGQWPKIEDTVWPYPAEFSLHPMMTQPTYPWGMPMNPVWYPSHGGASAIPAVQGGRGIMWTPAGWAVQDAAMKHALRSAEVKTRYASAKRRHPKNYFRTKTCKFFAEGSCPHGEECTYLHETPSDTTTSDGEREKAPSAATKPKPGTNPRLRTLPCKFFNSSGGCNNGETCSFLHTLVVPASAPLVERPRPWRTRPCRHYQLGRCTLGDACHFAHVLDPNQKVLPCKDWARTGRCEMGQTCTFLHEGEGGEENIRNLTEEKLAEAFEEMRGTPIRGIGGDESDDEDDDDLEIVTEHTSRTVSPARSMGSLVPVV